MQEEEDELERRKKVNDMSNGTPKNQQPNIAFQRGGGTAKNEGRVQNGMP
jgi:hypothetical protein